MCDSETDPYVPSVWALLPVVDVWWHRRACCVAARVKLLEVIDFQTAEQIRFCIVHAWYVLKGDREVVICSSHEDGANE